MSRRRRPQPSLTLVQLTRQRPEALIDRLLINHIPQFYTIQTNPARLFSYAA
jgi:hypothetical protein